RRDVAGRANRRTTDAVRGGDRNPSESERGDADTEQYGQLQQAFHDDRTPWVVTVRPDCIVKAGDSCPRLMKVKTRLRPTTYVVGRADRWLDRNRHGGIVGDRRGD